MPTFATQVTDYSSQDQFFYLKITGLPYYIFGAVNPTSSTYGASAWTLPTGFSAVRGLMLPDDTMEQKLPDIIGGIASAPRLRLGLLDFPDTRSSGGDVSKGLFAQLLSPGRALSSSAVKIAKLKSSITATATAGGTFTGTTHTALTNGDVYIGTETMNVTVSGLGGDGTGQQTFTIVTRNKFPCYRSSDGTVTWPPTPYHRVSTDVNGNPDRDESITIASDLITLYGRTCALYVGHMKPSGVPEAESQSSCLMIGRIAGVDYGGPEYELTVESITADLTNAKVAPDLGYAELVPKFYLANAAWRKFTVIFHEISTDANVNYHEVSVPVTVDNGGTNIYASLSDLINEVNKDMGAAVAASQFAQLGAPVLTELPVGNETRLAFRWTTKSISSLNLRIAVAAASDTGTPEGDRSGISLLTVLGFEGQDYYQADDGTTGQGSASSGKHQFIIAQKTVPQGYVPTAAVSTHALELADRTSVHFFSDQGDGSGIAYARLGNGQVVQASATDTGANTVTVGPAINSHLASGSQAATVAASLGKLVSGDDVGYYLARGVAGTLEQIIMTPTGRETTPPNNVVTVGQFLCSSKGAGTDTTFNVFAEGVGLGWLALVNTDDFRIGEETSVSRRFVVDRSTKFVDIFTPMARERGYWLVWDPSTERYRLRRMHQPGAASSVLSSFSLTDANRATEKDRTKIRFSGTSMRTGWLLAYGWDVLSQKFVRQPIALNERWSRSTYGVDHRQEKIEDKTIPSNARGILELGEAMTIRLLTYRHPWAVCSRSVNKKGMLLAPGTVHQIVDNTIPNPYTAAMGVTSADGVYGLLTSVSVNPSTGDTEVEFVINVAEDAARYRQWSPTGLIDFAAASNGYNAGTKTLTFVANYTNQSGKYDGADFIAGDKVVIITRDNDGAAAYTYTDTVASVATDGLTVVLTTGLGGALSTTVHSIMVLDDYANSTAARQTGANKVAFMGDGSNNKIGGSAVGLHRWS